MGKNSTFLKVLIIPRVLVALADVIFLEQGKREGPSTHPAGLVCAPGFLSKASQGTAASGSFG